jgi:hypothetical protein
MRIFLIVAIFLCQISDAQTNSTFYFNRFGWTLQLPADFKLVSTNTTELMKDDGQELIEKELGKPVNRNETVDLISAAKDSDAYVNANYTISTKINKENWLEGDRKAKALILKAIAQKLTFTPKIDNRVTYIDKIKFNELGISYKISNDQIYHVVYLSSFIRGYYFTITYSYANLETFLEIIEMLNSSKFKK